MSIFTSNISPVSVPKNCPGFSQDRVNFYKKPGGETAGPAHPKWPNKTVPSWGAGWGEDSLGSGGRGASGVKDLLH